MPGVVRPTQQSIVALAAALNRVVPQSIVLEATPNSVRIGTAGGHGVRIVEVWDADVSLEDFARALLDALQDEVTEDVTHMG